MKGVISFCNENSIITSSEYGFRNCRSTKFETVAQKEHILELFEQGLLTVGVFLNYSKTLNQINHQTLLSKLYNYGIHGTALAFIQSYLS